MKWLAQVVQHSVANRALEDVVIIAKEVVELVAQENVSIHAETLVNIVVLELKHQVLVYLEIGG